MASQKLRPDRFVAVAAYGDYGTACIGTKIAYSQGGYETRPGVTHVAPEVESVLTDADKETAGTNSTRTREGLSMSARRRSRGAWTATLALLVLAGAGGALFGQERGPIHNGRSPASRLRSVDLADVRWTGGFWKQKFDLVKDVTIPQMWKFFDEGGVSHWKNFQIAGGLAEGEWSGRSWHDGDFYKWLEAVAHVYCATRDPKLDRHMDQVIEVIAKVQQPDGYLSTEIILEQKKERFEDIHRHELYNMGHLLTAACIHHRATGKTTLLDVARKTADYLHETFKDRPPELAHFGFNPSQIMGAVELYRTTGDRKYLALAETFIAMRGSRPAPFRWPKLGGTDQTQDRVPLRKAQQVVGHAVTATYLYCGAADAYMETSDGSLLAALERLWSDVARRKMYIHGGVGPLTIGASIRQDHVHEAFADPYSLPTRRCYCETCANIGYAMWNWRMLNISGEGRFGDVMERVFYNGGISGLALDGDHFFYSNVLRRLDENVPLLRSDTPQRWKHRQGYCCPPQLARTIAKMHGFAYSASEEGLWVHLYGSNVLKTTLANGVKVKLTQQTDYPWQGDVAFKLELPEAATFSLHLRIPAWAGGARVQVNGAAADVAIEPGRYVELNRTWKSGDTVALSLPMNVRLVKANPLVEELRGQVAVMRGPLVYCLESVDLADGVHVMDVTLPRDVALQPRFDAELLGGVTVLEGEALARHDADWSGPQAYDSPMLYKDVEQDRPAPTPIRLIPYYAWANRGAAQMTVWMPCD